MTKLPTDLATKIPFTLFTKLTLLKQSSNQWGDSYLKINHGRLNKLIKDSLKREGYTLGKDASNKVKYSLELKEIKKIHGSKEYYYAELIIADIRVFDADTVYNERHSFKKYLYSNETNILYNAIKTKTNIWTSKDKKTFLIENITTSNEHTVDTTDFSASTLINSIKKRK